MGLFLEYGYTSFNKYGEELCGDMVSIVKKNDYTTLVLADGLGSGVKANILATLTSKILSTMVSNNIPMEECVETIVQTLPVCKERGVAYSTFSSGNSAVISFSTATSPDAIKSSACLKYFGVWWNTLIKRISP